MPLQKSLSIFCFCVCLFLISVLLLELCSLTKIIHACIGRLDPICTARRVRGARPYRVTEHHQSSWATLVRRRQVRVSFFVFSGVPSFVRVHRFACPFSVVAGNYLQSVFWARLKLTKAGGLGRAGPGGAGPGQRCWHALWQRWGERGAQTPGRSCLELCWGVVGPGEERWDCGEGGPTPSALLWRRAQAVKLSLVEAFPILVVVVQVLH